MLNAKQHEREAQIVAQAGRPGAVTIATNMAGRGTDIVLGGNLEAELDRAAATSGRRSRRARAVRADWQARHDKVVAAGGLHIVGTERHESRRIDNQLRGRSGRQGDPGSSRFYLSMEDNLMRIFGDPVRTKRLLQMAGMKEGEVIESGMLTRQIEKAQRKVEAHNFDIRKQLLLFDDVANDQRKVIYQQRTEIMGTEDLSARHRRHPRRGGRRRCSISTCRRARRPSDWDLDGLAEALREGLQRARRFEARGSKREPRARGGRRCASASSRRSTRGLRRQGRRASAQPIMRHVEKDMMLRMLDQHWREHLAAMDYLRQGIHLRGYAQKDYASSTSARPSSCSRRCSTA